MKKFLVCFLAMLVLATSSVALIGCGKNETLKGEYSSQVDRYGESITLYFYKDGEMYVAFEDDGEVYESYRGEYKILKEGVIAMTNADGDTTIVNYERVDKNNIIIWDTTFTRQK